jgi:hypothetical protein
MLIRSRCPGRSPANRDDHPTRSQGQLHFSPAGSATSRSVRLTGICALDRAAQAIGVGRASKQVQRLHHAFVLCLGKHDDGAGILPRHPKRRPVVPNLVHLLCQAPPEVGIGDGGGACRFCPAKLARSASETRWPYQSRRLSCRGPKGGADCRSLPQASRRRMPWEAEMRSGLWGLLAWLQWAF